MKNDIEISVGLPFLKCSSNPSQTINVKTNKKSKTAVTKKIASEAFERIGIDPDINPDESYKNMYLTNIKSTEEYLELIENRKQEIDKQLKAHNKKKTRKDTVDTLALVVKPAIECMIQLTEQEQIQFLKDSKKVIEDIFKQYINPNFKFEAAVMHFDELSPHLHCLGMPLVVDEKSGIEIFNAKKFLSLSHVTALNRNYSIKMKELGWNVKDFELYEDMTPEEREEHKKNKKNHGRDSLRYKKEEKAKLEQQLSNLSDLKNEAIEKLTQKADVKELAINQLEQQLKDDGTIKDELINKVIRETPLEEFNQIENETKELFKLDARARFENDEKLQLEAKKQAKKKLLEENLNKMEFTSQDTINYYKQLDSFNDMLQKDNERLLFKNNIFKKVLKFVSSFLPNAIQEKVNKWIGINDMQEVEEQEITKDIIQFMKDSETDNLEESEVL